MAAAKVFTPGSGRYPTVQSCVTAAALVATYNTPALVIVPEEAGFRAEVWNDAPYVEVVFWKAGAGQTCRGSFGTAEEVGTVRRALPYPAAIALTFDDPTAYEYAISTANFAGTGMVLRDYASSKGIPLTYALYMSGFTGGSLTGDILRTMFWYYGAEIACHGYTHGTPATDVAAVVEMVRAKEALKATLAETNAAGYVTKNIGLPARTWIRPGPFATPGLTYANWGTGYYGRMLRSLYEVGYGMGDAYTDPATPSPSTAIGQANSGDRYGCQRLLMDDVTGWDTTMLDELLWVCGRPGQLTCLATHTPGAASALSAANLKLLIDKLSVLLEAGTLIPVTAHTLGSMILGASVTALDWDRQLIRNAGFEGGVAAGFLPTKTNSTWDSYVGWFKRIMGTGAVTIEAAAVDTGVLGATVTCGVGGGFANSGLLMQSVNTRPGHSYILKFRANIPVGTSMRLTISRFLPDGVKFYIGGDDQQMIFTGAAAYATYFVTFANPVWAGNRTSLCFWNNTASTSYYLDNVAVLEA